MRERSKAPLPFLVTEGAGMQPHHCRGGTTKFDFSRNCAAESPYRGRLKNPQFLVRLFEGPALVQVRHELAFKLFSALTLIQDLFSYG